MNIVVAGSLKYASSRLREFLANTKLVQNKYLGTFLSGAGAARPSLAWFATYRDFAGLVKLCFCKQLLESCPTVGLAGKRHFP